MKTGRITVNRRVITLHSTVDIITLEDKIQPGNDVFFLIGFLLEVLDLLFQFWLIDSRSYIRRFMEFIFWITAKVIWKGRTISDEDLFTEEMQGLLEFQNLNIAGVIHFKLFYRFYLKRNKKNKAIMMMVGKYKKIKPNNSLVFKEDLKKEIISLMSK